MVIFPTGYSGEVWWRGHGDHRRCDVFCLDSLLYQLVHIWRVNILIVVPSETIERYQKQLVTVPRPRAGQRQAVHTEQSNQHQQELELHPDRLIKRRQLGILRWLLYSLIIRSQIKYCWALQTYKDATLTLLTRKCYSVHFDWQIDGFLKSNQIQ